jgi:DNA-binding response OmpR family regulator
VIKPFVFDDLLTRINAVLRLPAPASRTALVVAGDLEMDMAARVVRRDGKEIPMTLKEFSLLECFMREPNVVLSREKLFECAWGLHSFSWSNVLDVHMKNLRKKINTRESKTFFETVRGVGYRLRVPIHNTTSMLHARFMKPV